MTRAINDQCKYYSYQKFTIAFPEHWEMDKWKSRNASCPEELVIRIRDPQELIADQCVNPIIQFFMKE